MQTDLEPAPRPKTGANLLLQFGGASGSAPARCPLGLPVIAGASLETYLADTVVTPRGRRGTLELFESDGWLIGWTAAPRQQRPLEAATHDIYADLIGATRDRGRHLCRIWNYVPEINTPGGDGLENYRGFSRARSLAFEHAFGPGFHHELPAASAVGTQDDRLFVVFAAHHLRPSHCENPLQVPAYQYPEQYGPRPPSFARASVLTHANRQRDVFVSGTSAIMGHETVAPDDTLAQTDCTLQNLRQISRSCGLASDLGRGRCALRQVKVYLRRPDEQAAVATVVDPVFDRATDHVSYVQAAICRSALNVEIEVSIFGATD